MRHYEGMKLSIEVAQDPKLIMDELMKLDRWAKQINPILQSAFTAGNQPSAIVGGGGPGGVGNLPDHKHSFSGDGGSFLGDTSRTITIKGTWDFTAATTIGIDHGDLVGLTDDDHSVYFLLAGRAGGQSASGGTAASENLILSSTAHATKGTIRFGADVSASRFYESTNRMAINTSSSDAQLHVRGTAIPTVPGLYVEGSDTTDGTTVGQIVTIDATRSDGINGVTQNTTLQINADIDQGFGGDHYALESNMDCQVYSGFPTSTNYGSVHAKVATNGALATAYQGTIRSIYAEATHDDSGAADNLQGVSVFLTASDGNVTTASGIKIDGNVSSGTTASFRGIEIDNPANTSTLTNLYGIYLEDMTAGTNDWSIYSNGADSYFKNTIRIADALRLIEAAGVDSADYVEIKAPATVGTSYGIELDDNGPPNPALAKFAALSAAVTVQTFVDIPQGRLFIQAYDMRHPTSTTVAAPYGTAPDDILAWELAGDAAGQDTRMATFQVPSDYSTGTNITVKIVWFTNTGAVGETWVSRVYVIPLSTGEDVQGGSSTLTGSHSANVTADALQEDTVSTFTATPGEWVRFRIGRDATHGSDNYTPDSVYMVGAVIEYTRNI